MELLMQIGQKIKTFRQVKGWSQENMAKLLRMSISGYSKIERGESDFKVSRIEAIAKVFNINPSQLLQSEDTTHILNTISGGTNSIMRDNTGTLHIHNAEEIAQLKKDFLQLQKEIEGMRKS
jgi:transcriptional regulator with XRE-family HTH domain